VTRSETLDEILRVPWVIHDYQNWLKEKPAKSQDDYLYAQSRIRFAPADHDRLAIPETATIVPLGADVGVRVSANSPPIRIPSVPKVQVESILRTLRERPLLIELPLLASVPEAACEQVMRVGFGKFVFAPSALEELEKCASAAEIVRFPGSPYEIERNYWTNVGQLSTHVGRTLNEPTGAASFALWLRELHVQLLLGEDFATFYCPSSPIAALRVAPGALYTNPTRTIASALGRFIVDGPRVNASAVGGSRYLQLLCRSLDMAAPSIPEREIYETGAYWGAIVTARARSEDQDREWFLPPRPMKPENWELLWESWSLAARAVCCNDSPNSISQLARFHWYFVHLHPFSCANQSLAFTLINCLLNRLAGSGISQLVLDHWALRLNCPEYVRLFGRAVAVWTTTESSPMARHQDRMRKRQELDKFVSQLNSSRDELDAAAISKDQSEAAHLALLVDH
jgi:hypothetical protein